MNKSNIIYPIRLFYQINRFRFLLFLFFWFFASFTQTLSVGALVPVMQKLINIFKGQGLGEGAFVLFDNVQKTHFPGFLSSYEQAFKLFVNNFFSNYSVIGLMYFFVSICVVFTFFNLVLIFSRELTQLVIRSSFARLLRDMCVKKLEKLPYSFFSKVSAPKIIATAMEDVIRINEGIVALFFFSLSCLNLLFYFSILFYFYFRLSLILLLMGSSYFIFKKMLMRLTAYVKKQRSCGISFSEGVYRYVQHIQAVRLSSNKGEEEGRLLGVSQQLFENERKMFLYKAGSSIAVRLMCFVFSVITIYCAIWLLSKGYFSIEKYMAFFLFSYAMYRSLSKLSIHLASIRIARFSWTYLWDYFLNLPEDTIVSGSLIFEGVQSQIFFENVTFAYGSSESVLNHFSLTLKKGEVVGLVGESGAGKSTVVSLLARFYDIQSGEIYIDGSPLRDYNLANLRSQIGLVPQNVSLISGSFFDNIVYGNTETSLEEVKRVASLARIDELIESCPDGYDQFVGEGGTQLSGGERQRILIARLMLKSPDIIVLDEATSALDNHSEHMILEALVQLTQGKTVLMIAHRLHTIQNCDKIVFMKDGGIVEEGTYDELMTLKGFFYDMNQAN